MASSIVCQSCTRAYAIKPELAGKKAKCKCGSTIRFPEAGNIPIAGTSRSKSSVKTSATFDSLELPADVGAYDTAPVEIKQVGPSDTFPCSNCKSPLELNTVICMRCGTNQKTGQAARTQVLAAPPAPVKQSAASSGGGNGGGRSGMGNMVIGGILVVVGLGVTIGTYTAANNAGGGSYYIFYGPVIFGAIQFLKGLTQMMSGE